MRSNIASVDVVGGGFDDGDGFRGRLPSPSPSPSPSPLSLLLSLILMSIALLNDMMPLLPKLMLDFVDVLMLFVLVLWFRITDTVLLCFIDNGDSIKGGADDTHTQTQLLHMAPSPHRKATQF